MHFATTHEDIPRLHSRKPLARAYVGVTSDLPRRIHEHRRHLVPGHTQRYRITRLVHCEDAGSDAYAAIAREKQLKGWRREKKIALIMAGNPTWEDLAADWYG